MNDGSATNGGGAKLRAWRLQRGIYQSQVGAEIGVSAEAVGRYENKTLTPALLPAVHLELMTGGDVSLEDWGIDADVVALLRRFVTARIARERAVRHEPEPT